MAKLYFRYGAMGSSKTANALMVWFNYKEKGQVPAGTRTAETKDRYQGRGADHTIQDRPARTLPLRR